MQLLAHIAVRQELLSHEQTVDPKSIPDVEMGRRSKQSPGAAVAQRQGKAESKRPHLPAARWARPPPAGPPTTCCNGSTRYFAGLPILDQKPVQPQWEKGNTDMPALACKPGLESTGAVSTLTPLRIQALVHEDHG
ncbi:UNVERIFIED_CONTAM: hypothetical protein K2H54_015015 [Gekko kuhli]